MGSKGQGKAMYKRPNYQVLLKRLQEPRRFMQVAKQFKVYKKLLVGGQGIPIEEFITTDVDAWF